jgi:hypothetical protein
VQLVDGYFFASQVFLKIDITLTTTYKEVRFWTTTHKPNLESAETLLNKISRLKEIIDMDETPYPTLPPPDFFLWF